MTDFLSHKLTLEICLLCLLQNCKIYLAFSGEFYVNWYCRFSCYATVFSKSESSQSPSLRGQLQLEAVVAAAATAFAEASRTIIYDSV